MYPINRQTTVTTTTVTQTTQAPGYPAPRTVTTAQGNVIPGAGNQGRGFDSRGRSVQQVAVVQQYPAPVATVPCRDGSTVVVGPGANRMNNRDVRVVQRGDVPLAQQDAMRRAEQGRR